MFIGPHYTAPHPTPHLIATEAPTVGKREVRIQLECFLVQLKAKREGPYIFNEHGRLQILECFLILCYFCVL